MVVGDVDDDGHAPLAVHLEAKEDSPLPVEAYRTRSKAVSLQLLEVQRAERPQGMLAINCFDQAKLLAVGPSDISPQDFLGIPWVLKQAARPIAGEGNTHCTPRITFWVMEL